MGFLWQTMRKDLRRHRRNPLEFLLWICKVHLLVADEDDNFLSGLLVGALSQEEIGGMIRAEEVDRTTGRERIAAGKASALLIIPAGFADAVLKEQPTTLQLLTNPSQNILPGIVEETLSIFVDGMFYLQRLLGDELRAMAEGPPDGQNTFPDAYVAMFSVQINQIAERVTDYLSPMVIELVEEEKPAAEAEEPEFNFGLLFVPSILLMGLIFMSRVLGDDLWHEREARTLRRIVVSPQNVTAFLGGKFLAGMILMGLVCLVGMTLGYAYFQLNPLTWPLAVAWAVGAGTMLMALMTLVQVFASSQRAGNIVTLVLVFPLMMLGGSFFPFEAMPGWMARVGQFTPNGWALQQLKEIIMQDFQVGSLLVGFLVMGAVVVAGFLVIAWRLRTGFAQG
jgi:ABC-type multidrug transport system permease subunit